MRKQTKERILSYNCHCNRPGNGRPLRNSLPGLILLLAGCVQPAAVRNESPVTASGETGVGHYLGMLYQFSGADSQDRAALYERVSTSAVLEPTASNRLRLALLKAWPGHPGHNPEAAQQMLRTALIQRQELTPEVENLARVYLLIIDQQQQASNHNRMLTSELEEARSKLEALTTIERTVETTPRAEAVQ